MFEGHGRFSHVEDFFNVFRISTILEDKILALPFAARSWEKD